MLLVGMAHDASLKRNLALAVPRVGLALVLGIVISTPLTLQVFHREIDSEVVALQAEASDSYKHGLDTDERFRDLPALRTKVATERSIIASGGATDPALGTVRAQVGVAQTAYDQAQHIAQDLTARAQCELNGTCGTRRAGDGTAYQQAKSAADAQAGVVTAAKGELDAATATATAAQARSAQQAQGVLATDQGELTRLTAEQTRLQAAFDATTSNDGGILLRLQALSRLSDSNATLGAAHLLLSLLFISIEILPVLMKILLNVSPATAYDRLAELRDRTDIDVEALQQEARRTVEQAQTELLVMAEQERVDRQKEAVKARRRARLAAEALARAVPPAPELRPPGEEDTVRRPWETSPGLRLARNAAVRTVRPLLRRGAERAATPA